MVRFLVLHLPCIASRKKSVFCLIKYRKNRPNHPYLTLVYASIFWYKLLCFVNAYVRTHEYWNISASSEYYKIETRSAVPMKKKKTTTTAVHITGYNTLALYFCATCSDKLSIIHTHTRTHTHTLNMQYREVKVAHCRKVYIRFRKKYTDANWGIWYLFGYLKPLLSCL